MQARWYVRVYLRTYAEPLPVGRAVPTLLLFVVFKSSICVSPVPYRPAIFRFVN